MYHLYRLYSFLIGVAVASWQSMPRMDWFSCSLADLGVFPGVSRLGSASTSVGGGTLMGVGKRDVIKRASTGFEGKS